MLSSVKFVKKSIFFVATEIKNRYEAYGGLRNPWRTRLCYLNGKIKACFFFDFIERSFELNFRPKLFIIQKSYICSINLGGAFQSVIH